MSPFNVVGQAFHAGLDAALLMLMAVVLRYYLPPMRLLWRKWRLGGVYSREERLMLGICLAAVGATAYRLWWLLWRVLPTGSVLSRQLAVSGGWWGTILFFTIAGYWCYLTAVANNGQQAIRHLRWLMPLAFLLGFSLSWWTG